jgi:hypothetical protein
MKRKNPLETIEKFADEVEYRLVGFDIDMGNIRLTHLLYRGKIKV